MLPIRISPRLNKSENIKKNNAAIIPPAIVSDVCPKTEIFFSSLVEDLVHHANNITEIKHIMVPRLKVPSYKFTPVAK